MKADLATALLLERLSRRAGCLAFMLLANVLLLAVVAVAGAAVAWQLRELNSFLRDLLGRVTCP